MPKLNVHKLVVCLFVCFRILNLLGKKKKCFLLSSQYFISNLPPVEKLW